MEHFFELVDKITADLGNGDVSSDELTRAKVPIIEAVKRSQQANGYWVQNLRDAQTDPRRLDRIRKGISGYEAVTADDVRAIASTYLKPDRFWRLKILPANGSAVR